MCYSIGRGRAEGSKCILVTSKSEVAEKETVNIWKEEQMNEAIKEIQKWSEEQFLKKVGVLASSHFNKN